VIRARNDAELGPVDLLSRQRVIAQAVGRQGALFDQLVAIDEACGCDCSFLSPSEFLAERFGTRSGDLSSQSSRNRQGAGFGFFIPVFFIISGLRFDTSALFSSASTIARVPLFLLALVAVRGVPALLYGRLLPRRQQIAAGLLQATSLPFIVTAAMIGQQLGVFSRPTAAGLIAAGMLSVIAFPLAGLALLRGAGERVAHGMPTPATPVLGTEDRALCLSAMGVE
jgi:hypothetical protein